MEDWKERKEYYSEPDIQGRLMWIICNMIENPDNRGIYPTTDCVNDIKDFIEALIKETEQRILTEAYNLKQSSYYYGDVIDPDHILQLIEKYIKGVE